jgi:hypothetical protein
MLLEITASSDLAATPDVVWARVATLEGINHELGPWMRMTAPRREQELTVEEAPLGERWFRSWVLLLGVLPFDYDDLCLEALEPGRGFRERSTMLSARRWHHDRTLERLPGGGTRVTDRVAFEPRVGRIAPLHRAIIAATFRHRHRRLLAAFGSVSA